MQIARIETIRLLEHPNALWVRVHTTEGLIGLGETYYIPAAVEAVIHDFAAALLLGKSVFDRERHWQNLFSSTNFFGYAGAEMRAVSALDLALWDLLGQFAGQPIYGSIAQFVGKETEKGPLDFDRRTAGAKAQKPAALLVLIRFGALLTFPDREQKKKVVGDC